MKLLKPIIISGKEVLPIIEGGKGISITTGQSSGAFAAAGAVGTFSGVYGDYYDEKANFIPLSCTGKTRTERNIQLINHAINAAISQARIAFDISKGKGRVHMNLLWGISSVEKILQEVLAKAHNMIHGVTCGAGMPFKLAEIAAKYGVFYYPIVSSARAFTLLWKRSYVSFKEWLGGVVYEDPWKAGGHNGITNKEDPNIPESSYERVVALRQSMNACQLNHVPIIMAGGVWFLRDWEDWIDNPEIGPIAFQLGTRPLLTVESPISNEWKKKLLTLNQEDIKSNHFSPTGFYSLAVLNDFVKELQQRSERQVPYSKNQEGDKTVAFVCNKDNNRAIYLTENDNKKAIEWFSAGYTKIMYTPDSTVIFVTQERYNQIVKDQLDCVGCLSYCHFSNWSDNKELTKTRSSDPRSYCIRKTLHDIAHGGDVEKNLMFSGSNGYLFKDDPFYANGFIPTVQQLIDRLLTGN